MQLLVIAAFLAIYIHDSMGDAIDNRGHSSTPAWLFLAGGLGILGCISWLVSMLSSRALDRRGNPSAFTWNEVSLLVLQVAACTLFYYAVLGLGWLDFVRSSLGDIILVDELLALAPLLVFACVLWLGAYSVERRWYDALFSRWMYTGRPLFALPSRRAFVVGKVRHQILFFAVPLALLMGWREFCYMEVPEILGLIDAHGRAIVGLSPWKYYLPEAVQLAGVAVVLSLVPLVLVFVWDTVPLGEGVLRERLMDLCRKYGVGVRNLLVWRTHGTMANGAAMGFFRPVRYILLTDQLLESLPTHEVEAVMAHEVAHIKHRHILWLAAAIVASVFLTGGVTSWIGRFAGISAESQSGATLLWILSLSSLGIVAAVFGMVSRRFEWQADAFAVRHMARSLPAAGEIGDGETGSHAAVVTQASVNAMSQALSSVAELNGIGIKRLSFRHGSIHTRQGKLRSLIGQPLGEFGIDREAKLVRLIVCIALLAGLTLSLMDFFIQPPGSVDNKKTTSWDSPTSNNASAL